MNETSKISNSPDRKVYCSPSLIEIGSISEITKGGENGIWDGGEETEASSTGT